MNATATKTATTKETAAALRKTLRATFPGTKFSVTMSTGTGYGWLHVRWTDGPTAEAVREVTSGFESSRFSGMDDAYHATENTQWDCRGINTSRSISDEVMEATEARVRFDSGHGAFIDTEEGAVHVPHPASNATPHQIAYTYLAGRSL